MCVCVCMCDSVLTTLRLQLIPLSSFLHLVVASILMYPTLTLMVINDQIKSIVHYSYFTILSMTQAGKTMKM